MTTAMTETEERLCLDVGTLFEKTAKLRGRVNSLEESLPPKHDALVDRVVALEDRVSDLEGAPPQNTGEPGTTDERLTKLETAMVLMAQAGKAKTLADALAFDAMAELNARLRAQERGVTDICNQFTDMTARLIELEVDREPVQQDCGCEELWRLAKKFADPNESRVVHDGARENLIAYVREHGTRRLPEPGPPNAMVRSAHPFRSPIEVEAEERGND